MVVYRLRLFVSALQECVREAGGTEAIVELARAGTDAQIAVRAPFF